MTAQAGFYVSAPNHPVEFFHCTQVSGSGPAAQKFVRDKNLPDGTPVCVMVPSMDGRFVSAVMFFRAVTITSVTASWND